MTGTALEIVTYLMSIEDKTALFDLSLHKEIKRRSLNANSYFYVLLTKIAEKLRVSLTEVHNIMIARYGYPEFKDDKIVYFILPDRIDVNALEGVHLKATDKTQILDNGEVNRVYLLMRGSHTYNTAEMARLIDGVVTEAKNLDIETLTPDELEHLKSLWQSQKGKKE